MMKEEEIKKEERIGPHSFRAIMKLGQGSFGVVFLVNKINSSGEITSKKFYAMKILNKKQILG